MTAAGDVIHNGHVIVSDLTVGHGHTDRGAAERALDQLLGEMVTINPATTVRWDDQVGSIEVGKAADLLVIDGRSAAQKQRVRRTVRSALSGERITRVSFRNGGAHA